MSFWLGPLVLGAGGALTGFGVALLWVRRKVALGAVSAVAGVALTATFFEMMGVAGVTTIVATLGNLIAVGVALWQARKPR